MEKGGSTVPRFVHIAILLLSPFSALASVPFALPDVEDRDKWAVALSIGDFEIGRTGAGTRVEIESDGPVWTVIAIDEAGEVRTATLPRPTNDQEREEIASVARSLLSDAGRRESVWRQTIDFPSDPESPGNPAQTPEGPPPATATPPNDPPTGLVMEPDPKEKGDNRLVVPEPAIAPVPSHRPPRVSITRVPDVADLEPHDETGPSPWHHRLVGRVSYGLSARPFAGPCGALWVGFGAQVNDVLGVGISGRFTSDARVTGIDHRLRSSDANLWTFARSPIGFVLGLEFGVAVRQFTLERRSVALGVIPVVAVGPGWRINLGMAALEPWFRFQADLRRTQWQVGDDTGDIFWFSADVGLSIVVGGPKAIGDPLFRSHTPGGG